MTYEKFFEFELTNEERKNIMQVEKVLKQLRNAMSCDEVVIVNAPNKYAGNYSNTFDLGEINRVGQLLVMLRDSVDIEVRGENHGEMEESE